LGVTRKRLQFLVKRVENEGAFDYNVDALLRYFITYQIIGRICWGYHHWNW
jgi:hypothetical protein